MNVDNFSDVNATGNKSFNVIKYYDAIRFLLGKWVKGMCCIENLEIYLYECQRPAYFAETSLL